jgi:hypothetical protein
VHNFCLPAPSLNGIFKEEEVRMNQQVLLHDGALVCGTLSGVRHCVCLRPPGHWGPHVVKMAGKYLLVQTDVCAITFEIAEPVAHIAMNDKDWSWAE